VTGGQGGEPHEQRRQTEAAPGRQERESRPQQEQGGKQAQRGAQGQGEDEEHTKKTTDPRRTIAEWTSLFVSLAVLGATLSVIIHGHVTRGETSPVLEAQADTSQTRHAGESYFVPVVVRNTGGAAARDVYLRVVPGAAQRTPQAGATQAAVALAGDAAMVLIDLVHPGAEATGTAVFRTDPRASGVTVQILGYADP
jgi:uncharacterized protein (TIGR02588 family)